jgi:hypothetical protein
MRLICPHCQSPVDCSDPLSADAIVCASRGLSSLNLDHPA